MTETRIIDLTPTATGRPVLSPETPVLVINRGFEVLVRKFDALDYELQPHTVGLMKMPYAAALHFQKHTTVAGTRDAQTNSEESYLGILRTDQPGWPEQIDIDPPRLCQPFTREEADEAGQRIEALVRDPGEGVVVANVAKAVAAGKVPVGRGQSSQKKGGGMSRKGVTADGDQVDRDEVLAPPDETAAERVERLNEEA